MPRAMKHAIRNAEWLIANSWYAHKTPATEPNHIVKFRRSQHDTENSFFKLDKQLYALDRKCLGKGAYGRVKLVQNGYQGPIYLAKITYRNGSSKGAPFIEKIFRAIGLVAKNADELHRYEQKTTKARGQAIACGVVEGSGKHIMIMRDLGTPISRYIKQHKRELQQHPENALALAEKIIKALNNFHHGFDHDKVARLHNDLKADNILIDNNHDIHLIDFGEAFDFNEVCSQQDADNLTPYHAYQHPRRISAAPDIVAPEVLAQTRSCSLIRQYGPGRRCYSMQSDLYSLGHVIKQLAPFSPHLAHLSRLMLMRNSTDRPTTGALLAALKGLQDQQMEDIEKAQALCVLVSNKQQNFYSPQLNDSAPEPPAHLADGTNIQAMAGYFDQLQRNNFSKQATATYRDAMSLLITNSPAAALVS